MSVEIIQSNQEPFYKIMFCNTSMWAFGPVFREHEDVDAFIDWLSDDPRTYTDKDLERKTEEWRDTQ